MSLEATLAESFPSGNFGSYSYTLSVYLPRALNLLNRTIVPAFEALLLQLLGSTRDFEKHKGNMHLYGNNESGIPEALAVELCYSALSLRVEGVSQDAVEHDKQFLLTRLRRMSQLAHLKDTAVTLDTNAGEIQLNITLHLKAPVPTQDTE